MFKEYLAYLKDNPEGHWFKAKLYGWGWTPAKWQGWVVLLVFLAVVILNFYRIDSVSHSVSDTLINFIPETALLTIIFLFICYKKGEKPGWKWGLRRDKI